MVGLVSKLKEQKLPRSGKSSCQQSSIMVLVGCVGKVSKWALYLEHGRWCFNSRGILLQACWRHNEGVLRMAPVHSRKASFWILARGTTWGEAKRTSTAWQRAFKDKTTWRAAIKCVAPINAWGMRETRLEELLGRNVYLSEYFFDVVLFRLWQDSNNQRRVEKSIFENQSEEN